MTVSKSRSRKKVKPMPFTVVTEVKAADVDSALVSALEGGSNYWIKWVEPAYNALTTERIVAGVHEITVTDEEGTKKTLNRAAIHKGLRLMAREQPRHFADLVSESDADATTGDVLLQLCLFGEVVYG